MLTTRAKNKIIDEVNVAFDAVGNKMPFRSKVNNESIAYEYYVSSLLYKRAEARRKQAKEAAIDAGLMFDADIEDNWRTPGTNEPTFQGEVVIINLTVAKPRVVLDQKLLVHHLVKRGVSKHVIGEALAEASTDAKPGHRFDAALMTKEGVENGK